MTRYETVRNLSIEDMAWFILTIIEDTENNMLNKLAEYGLDISLCSLDQRIRVAKIVKDLEVDDGSNT